MDIYHYSNNKISIKDLEGEIDISQRKWDCFFDFILQNTSSVYFWGARLEYMSVGLRNSIDLLVDQNIQEIDKDFFRATFKVKDSCILLGRGLINDVWKHYEYPSIIFLKKELGVNDFRRLSNAKYYVDIFEFIEGMYLVYKNFEPDVLWVEKTMEMEFPPEF
jgi:hypothetical protein